MCANLCCGAGPFRSATALGLGLFFSSIVINFKPGPNSGNFVHRPKLNVADRNTLTIKWQHLFFSQFFSVEAGDALKIPAPVPLKKRLHRNTVAD